MPDRTLVFIQASLGKNTVGTNSFYPNNVLENIAPEGQEAMSSLEFMARRMKEGFSDTVIALAVLTSRSEQDAPVREITRKIGLPCIMADEAKLGSGLCQFLRNSLTYARAVRLLGNHPFTDAEVVKQSIEEFKRLAVDVQETHKHGPDVCGFGQNIEVFSSSALLKKQKEVFASDNTLQKAKFEEFITCHLPNAPEWNVLSQELKAQMKTSGFCPIVSPLPGYVQEKTAANVCQIIGYHKERDLPFDSKTVFATWQRLKLKPPQWRWSDPRFKPQTFAEVGEALGRGLTTVAEIQPPAFLLPA